MNTADAVEQFVEEITEVHGVECIETDTARTLLQEEAYHYDLVPQENKIQKYTAVIDDSEPPNTREEALTVFRDQAKNDAANYVSVEERHARGDTVLLLGTPLHVVTERDWDKIQEHYFGGETPERLQDAAEELGIDLPRTQEKYTQHLAAERPERFNTLLLDLPPDEQETVIPRLTRNWDTKATLPPDPVSRQEKEHIKETGQHVRTVLQEEVEDIISTELEQFTVLRDSDEYISYNSILTAEDTILTFRYERRDTRKSSKLKVNAYTLPRETEESVQTVVEKISGTGRLLSKISDVDTLSKSKVRRCRKNYEGDEPFADMLYYWGDTAHFILEETSPEAYREVRRDELGN